MTTYFSVDVETTGSLPINGSLLSVGVSVVDYTLEIAKPDFYRTILPEEYTFDPDTIKWWFQQDKEILYEAFSARDSEEQVAHEFANWVIDTEPDPKKRCFVANPVAFDWPWINWLFLKHLNKNPFGHRALCLRSMAFGMEDEEWGKEREDGWRFHVTPHLPHHALSDAYAQAKSFILIMKERIKLNEFRQNGIEAHLDAD